MKTLPIKRFTALMLMALLMLSISGCSGDGGAGTGSSDSPDAGTSMPPTEANVPPTDVEHIVNPDRELFDSETLTIAVLFRSLISDSVAAYKRANPGVEIEIISYSEHAERDGHLGGAQQEIATALMAGSGPVLIEEALIDFRDPRTHVFLMDWFPVMKADPNFNEDDWFMNVFHASSRDGKLFGFPTAFSYNIVTSNSTIPGLPEAVSEYDGITMPELLEIYRTFTTDSPYYVESNFSVSWMINYFIADYLDMDTGLVDFNEEFAQLISYARSITDPEKESFGVGYGGSVPKEVEQLWSERFFFHFSDPGGSHLRFLNYEEPPIFDAMADTGLTYIASESGELLMYNWQTYLLNAFATPTQQALAWDFLRFMMEPENRSPSGLVFMQPTNRHLLRYAIENELPGWIRDERLKIKGTTNEAVEDVIAKMTAFGDMPMRNTYTLPGTLSGWPDGILAQAFRQFEDGLVSAEQTAANLQNQVELVLMEMGMR